MQEDWKRYIPLYLRIFRTVVLYPFFLLVWLFCNLAMTTFRTEYVYMFWLSAIFTYFIYFSVARVFFEGDAQTNTRFAESGAEGLWHRVRVVICSRAFFVDFAVAAFWLIVLPIEAGMYPLCVLWGGLSRGGIKLLLLALNLPLFFLITLWARLSAWQNHVDGGRSKLGEPQRSAPDMSMHTMARAAAMAGMGEESNTPVNEPTGTIDAAGRQWLRREIWNPTLPLKCLGLLGIYTVGGFGLYMVGPVLYSIWNGLLAVGSVRWWLPFAILAAIFVGFWLFWLLRAVYKRRQLFGRLKRLCREYGFRIERVKRPYASIFRYRDGANLRIHANKKTYDCKLFSAVRRHHEMFFDEKGFCRIRHTLRFRRVEFLSYTTQYEFAFESEHTKLCIVAPVPKVLYAGNEHFHRPIDTGMKVGDYRIFSTTGLLNALKRDCIEKS